MVMRSRSLKCALGVATTFAMLLTACSDADSDTSVGGDPASSVASAADAGDGTAFPVTVQTLHGPVTIEEEPDRVVVLDAAYVDAVVSLGVSPSAVSFAGSSIEDFPWLDGRIGTAALDPALSSDSGVNYEAVAAADPDLILGAWWLVDEAAFDRLSAIAPTVAGRTNTNDGWEARLEVAAEALGRSDRVQEVRDRVAESYADLAEQAPALDGLTYNYTGFSDIGLFFGNGSWLEPLGLVADDDQDNTQQAAPLSLELMDQLDADVWAIWPITDDDRARLESDGRFEQQPAVADGVVIWLDRALANATNAAGPLSLQWMVGQVTPTILDQLDNIDG